MHTPTLLLTPAWWYDTIVGLDTPVHLINIGQSSMLIGTLEGQEVEMENAAPPIVHVAALWSELEAHITATSRIDISSATVSFLDFLTSGVCGNVRRLHLPNLHIRITLMNSGDVSIASTAPASTHLRLARVHILSSWQHRIVWPSPIIPQLLARQGELGLPAHHTYAD